MTTERKNTVAWNVALWIAQGLLAITFLWAGFMKLFASHQLPFPWIKESGNLVVITGIVDLLAGLGMLLPALLNIKPKLTITAAGGIVVLMIAASVFHISRGEAKDIGFNIFMLMVSAFVVWGRRNKAPFR